jgi:hypothetical protein
VRVGEHDERLDARGARARHPAATAAARALRDGRLTNLTGEDLRTLAESEFWVLSSESRTSGAGFVLKQRLASLRQELAP